jgi:hypothetical protein
MKYLLLLLILTTSGCRTYYKYSDWAADFFDPQPQIDKSGRMKKQKRGIVPESHLTEHLIAVGIAIVVVLLGRHVYELHNRPTRENHRPDRRAETRADSNA